MNRSLLAQVPCPFDGLRQLPPGVISLGGLGRRVPHQDTGGLDIQTLIQIPLSERSPAHPEVELYIEVLLHDTLDSAYGITGKVRILLCSDWMQTDVAAVVPETSYDLFNRLCQTQQPIAADLLPADGFHHRLLFGFVRDCRIRTTPHIYVTGYRSHCSRISEYHCPIDPERVVIV